MYYSSTVKNSNEEDNDEKIAYLNDHGLTNEQ